MIGFLDATEKKRLKFYKFETNLIFSITQEFTTWQKFFLITAQVWFSRAALKYKYGYRRISLFIFSCRLNTISKKQEKIANTCGRFKHEVYTLLVHLWKTIFFEQLIFIHSPWKRDPSCISTEQKYKPNSEFSNLRET